MAKKSLFASLLTAFTARRRYLREQAIRDMLERHGGKYARHGGDEPEASEGFMVVEVGDPRDRGSDVNIYRLYKLVDETKVTMEFDLKQEVMNGITRGGGDELHAGAKRDPRDSAL